jgi:hypothetical protein
MSASSAVRIVSRRAANREEWERACAACSYATFFHTPAFADVFIKTSGGRMASATQTIQFSDGATCVLPLVNKHFFGTIIRISHSMPGATFGGWVSADPLTEQHARALVAHVRTIPEFIWRENPYDPHLAAIDIGNCSEDFTQTIDLREGYAVASARFDHAHRKAVKKALAKGVSVIEASAAEQWERYFALYSASRDRWKERGLVRNRGYDLALLRALFELSPSSRKLWIAQVKGASAAGILCFYWNRHAVAWLGAGAAEFFAYRPNNLLYENVIRHAAEAGYHWFDCNPSGGFRGVVEFKEHLGAQKLRSRIVDRRSPLLRAAGWIRGKIR